jgi:hypothetical protein
MSWNYRVVVDGDEGDPFWTFRSVHYNRDGLIVLYSVMPAVPGGGSLRDLGTDLAMMRAATALPALSMKKLNEWANSGAPPVTEEELWHETGDLDRETDSEFFENDGTGLAEDPEVAGS